MVYGYPDPAEDLAVEVIKRSEGTPAFLLRPSGKPGTGKSERKEKYLNLTGSQLCSVERYGDSL